MSTEIKNTLFRFVTMRSPELLEQDQIVKSFVTLPEFTSLEAPTNSFMNVAADVPSGKTKAKALAEAAATFEDKSIKNREHLWTSELVSHDFYDFAVWLTANRSIVTVEQINGMLNSSDPLAKFASLGPLTDEVAINTLWENLFYQIITFKSGYVRDAILSILIANFFLQEWGTLVDPADADFRKLAQARVIIPKVLLEKEDTSARKALIQDALDALPLNTRELDREMDVLLSKEKTESYKTIVAELKKVRLNYNKEAQKDYEQAVKEYEQTVKEAYENAEAVEKTVKDPITGFDKTIIEYTNVVIAPFEFERKPEFETGSLTGKVATGTESLVSGLVEANGYETFDEVISYYENLVDIGTQATFENTNLTQTYVSADGVVLPTDSTTSGNLFTLGAIYNSDPVPLKMLFSGSASDMDVVAANYTVTFDDETTVTGTSFTDSIINSRLALTIFREGLDLSGRTSMDIEGVLTMSDGKNVEFSGGVAITEGPFSLGSNLIADEGTVTSIVKGKGAYALKALAFDPDSELDDDVENPAADGSVVRYIPSGYGIKRLGIAEYRKVEQEVCCYVPGEVSHIENVMASEYREKATRRLRRTEDTTTTSNEQEIEKLTDTTSTDRFEMNQEVSSVIAEQNSIGVHAGFNYGMSNNSFVNGGADFAHSTSSEESDNQAVNQAKEITERALDRVVQKVKEERISKVIEEFEENNKHGFDNRKNNQHVSGVFRWVDKIYRNKVINYGKRLMYEFMIPQPATFHNEAVSLKKNDFGIEKIIKPIDPRVGDGIVMLKTHTDVTALNYSHWAAKYGAEINPAPALENTIGKEFTMSGSQYNGERVWADKSNIDIPEGYKAVDAKVFAAGKSMHPSVAKTGVGASVGNLVFDYFVDGIDAGREIPKKSNLSNQLTLRTHQKSIPVTVTSYGQYSIGINVSIMLERTPQYYEQWQIETYNAIIEAYEERLKEYEAKIAELKATQEEKIRSNPMFYRQIENTILRKNCIEYLASHNALGAQTFIKDSGITTVHADYDNPEMETYAATIKFFEQAFEWNLMSYYFYPFYWADKNKWAELYNVAETDDPTFRAFLQSGMARVIVTARPGFEEAVNWYMATGQIWNGGQVPTIDDPLFVSIVEELRETEGEVEETWESRVPTSLTIIQAGAIGLELDQALPCDDDCADYKLFDSDGEPVLDENGKQVSTNPFKKYDDVKLQGVDNTEEGDETPPIGGGEEESES
nr:hypothetical protein [uncultured Flavobacterium sp.]